ncbi:hypothetical protein SAMN04488570_2022 [Nocardioides scoriae]|uniref:Alkaline shock response membrane anchor protein AmaP n=1 Tax=Nocardioides scoriae TaxID=642780 RepID=A0A1H1SQK0_9ACTN|nr:hypothetical protein [Nocardioides scoriae]SDS50282.1 hypothetical protein SAMN04488570_2022 [Nocardioides scoriae]
MTSRRTLFLDRVATLLLALLLVAGGAAAAYWWSGRSSLPGTLDTGAVRDVVDAAWFSWIAALVGLVLILLGLRWIAAHLGRPTVSKLHLKGSGSQGRLDVAGSKVAGAAASALADTIGVRSARGTVVRDRGQLVAKLTAVIEPEADLRVVARQADIVSAQLRQVLEREDVRCSVEIRVATFARSLARAR